MSDEEPSWMKEPTVVEASAWSDPESDNEGGETRREIAASLQAPSNEETASKAQESDSYQHHRALQKRFRLICRDANVEAGGDANYQETMAEKFKKVVSIRKQVIKKTLNGIRLTRNVDLCFVIDASGSMSPHIEGVKDSVFKIVESLRDDKTNGTEAVERLRLAVVAYRDHDNHHLHFERLDFNTDVEKFHRFCKELKAISNTDNPEDALGGLNEALKLNWDHEEAGTKVIFHICDYPCHGTQFHTYSMHDNYPNGDPHGLSHTDLFNQIRAYDILYHFGKITELTNKMILLFGQAYKDKIPQFNIKDATQIGEAVITAVQVSVSTSARRASSTDGKKKSVRKDKDFVITPGEPNWEEIAVSKVTFMSYKPPNSIQDVVDDVHMERVVEEGRVKVASQPFDRGTERIVYYGRDVSVPSSNIDIVLKEYVHEYEDNLATRFEIANQTQSTAAYLAGCFCKELHAKTDCEMTIEFLKTKTVALKLQDGNIRYMSAEKRFSADHKFVRFSNNANYAMLETKAKKHGIPVEYVDLLMAFSHWTHQVTNEVLMVVDLQGIVETSKQGKPKIILTDPAIHCTDVTRFGSMNHGDDGMHNFFKRHECNTFCKKLGLKKHVFV